MAGTESDSSYYPDNAPVHYSVTGNTALFEQDVDLLLQVRKHMSVTFEDDGRICIHQQNENVSDQPISGAAWGVNTLDAGGEADICFDCTAVGGYNPQRVVTLWSNTN